MEQVYKRCRDKNVIVLVHGFKENKYIFKLVYRARCVVMHW